MAQNQGAWQLYGTTVYLNQGAWQDWFEEPGPEPPPFVIIAIDQSHISMSLGIGIH